MRTTKGPLRMMQRQGAAGDRLPGKEMTVLWGRRIEHRLDGTSVLSSPCPSLATNQKSPDAAAHATNCHGHDDMTNPRGPGGLSEREGHGSRGGLGWAEPG